MHTGNTKPVIHYKNTRTSNIDNKYYNDLTCSISSKLTNYYFSLSTGWRSAKQQSYVVNKLSISYSCLPISLFYRTTKDHCFVFFQSLEHWFWCLAKTNAKRCFISFYCITSQFPVMNNFVFKLSVFNDERFPLVKLWSNKVQYSQLK